MTLPSHNTHFLFEEWLRSLTNNYFLLKDGSDGWLRHSLWIGFEREKRKKDNGLFLNSASLEARALLYIQRRSWVTGEALQGE